MQKQTDKTYRTLIVGGGIAGLTLAFLLEQTKHHCEIIELAPAWKSLGGGITLTLNGMRMLNEIGLGKHVEAKGLEIKKIKITEANNRLLSCFDVGQYATTVAKTITIHRTELHEILRNTLKTAVYFNTTITLIEEQTEKIKVTFSDNRVCFYDLIVGCDGMYSSLRKDTFNNIRLKYAGYSCWRFVCKANGLSYSEDTLTEMWGKGKRFGIVPLPNKRIHCFASINTCTPKKLKSISIENFKSLFSEFRGLVPPLLDALTCNNVLLFNEIEDVHVKNWVKGRVILIGDAAHGMTPNLTQGASMAIEDAIYLSRAINEKRSIPEALNYFFNLRKRRVRHIQYKSALLGKVGQWQSPFLTGIRNYCWKKIPDKWIQKDFENLLIR